MSKPGMTPYRLNLGRVATWMRRAGSNNRPSSPTPAQSGEASARWRLSLDVIAQELYRDLPALLGGTVPPSGSRSIAATNRKISPWPKTIPVYHPPFAIDAGSRGPETRLELRDSIFPRRQSVLDSRKYEGEQSRVSALHGQRGVA
jgi:hypothetical protein